MSNIEGPQFDALTPEQLGQIDPRFLAGLGTPGSVQEVTPDYSATQPFIDDPYLAYGRAKYGTVEGTLGGTAIDPTNPSYFSKQGRAIADKVDDGGNDDGGNDDGGNDDGGNDDGTSEEKTNAFSRLKELLNRIGLSSLTSKVQDLIARGIVDNDAIMFELRDSDEYKKRFIGNVARKANNLPELSPLVYVALEQKFRETLKANGLNADLYDEQSDFVGLIEGDVSPGELQTRIEKGYRAVMDADPEVIRQMQELYNVGVADIAHFFLNPKKTAPELERKAQAAQVAARAKEQGKMQLTSITAEELVSRGYTESQAQQAFTILSESAGLYNEMAGEDALTQGQKIGSAFGYDTISKQAIQKRASVRKAAISSSSKFTSTTGATSGTTETGLNVAQ